MRGEDLRVDLVETEPKPCEPIEHDAGQHGGARVDVGVGTRRQLENLHANVHAQQRGQLRGGGASSLVADHKRTPHQQAHSSSRRRRG